MRVFLLVILAFILTPKIRAGGGIAAQDAGTSVPLVIVYPPVTSGVSEDEVSNVVNEVWAQIGRAGCLAIHAKDKLDNAELDRIGPFNEVMRRRAAGWVIISLHNTNDALRDSAAVHVWNRRLQGIDLGSGGASAVDAKTSYSLRLRTLLMDLRKDARIKAHIERGIAPFDPKPHLLAGEKDPLDLSLLLNRRAETVRSMAETKHEQFGPAWPMAITNAERDAARSGDALAIMNFERWFVSTKLRPDPIWSDDASVEDQLLRFESILTGLVILRAPMSQPEPMAELLAAHRRIIVSHEVGAEESMRVELKRAGPRAAAFQNALLKSQRNSTQPAP